METCNTATGTSDDTDRVAAGSHALGGSGYGGYYGVLARLQPQRKVCHSARCRGRMQVSRQQPPSYILFICVVQCMPVDFLRDARFVARAGVSRSDRLVRCSCNPGWKGPDCGTLDLLPVSDNLEDSAAYGTFPSSTTTGLAAWGGSVLPDPSNGSLYHGFFAEMALDCGLTAWYRNSMVVHATASTPTGPFTRQDLILNYFARGCPPLLASPHRYAECSGGSV